MNTYRRGFGRVQARQPEIREWWAAVQEGSLAGCPVLSASAECEVFFMLFEEPARTLNGAFIPPKVALSGRK